MKRKILLIGGGGHAAACLDVIEAEKFFIPIGVIERKGAMPNSESSCGLGIIGTDDDLEKFAAAGHSFLITIGHAGNPGKRIEIFKRLKRLSAHLPVIISGHAVVGTNTSLGEGSIVMHRAVVNRYARVGANCIVNTGVIIEHNCTIGDHCHLAPGSILGGGCKIGTGVLVGTGAIVLPGIKIAEMSIIGAGAVVTQDIKKPEIYVGIPARMESKRDE